MLYFNKAPKPCENINHTVSDVNTAGEGGF